MPIPGDLLVREYQYEYRTLLFGSGTSFVTTEVTGLLGMPDADDKSSDREYDHGQDPGFLRLPARVVAFNISIVGNKGADIERKLAMARKTFQVPRRRNALLMEPFVFWRPGEPKKVIYVRCTRRDFTSNYDTARGRADGSVELTAPDPVIYALEAQDEAVTLPGGAVTGNVLIESYGDFDDGSWPLVTVQGPATNPRIQNVGDDGRTLRVDTVMDADDILTIDAKTKEINISRDGGATWVDAWNITRADNEFWSVLPGVQQIVYSRSAGNTATPSTCTIHWQDAYA